MISHLSFTDDTICFMDAKRDQVHNLMFLLKSFESISGLKKNLSKSSMAGIEVHDVAVN